MPRSAENSEYSLPGAAAFFRMELHRENIFPFDHGDEFAAVRARSLNFRMP